jgi:anti-sigma factor RsiW
MTCRDFTPDVVDRARGVPLDPLREDAVTRHLRTCETCRALFDREQAMSRALRHLAEEQHVPAANDLQLRKLLASFDAPRARRRRVRVAVEWSLAASVLIVAGLAAGWKDDASRPRAPQVAATPAPSAKAAAGDFVVLPGADALPQFEHGQVIQVDIPSAAGVVRAEVLIGQDGLARAARLAQ